MANTETEHILCMLRVSGHGVVLSCVMECILEREEDVMFCQYNNMLLSIANIKHRYRHKDLSVTSQNNAWRCCIVDV